MDIVHYLQSCLQRFGEPKLTCPHLFSNILSVFYGLHGLPSFILFFFLKVSIWPLLAPSQWLHKGAGLCITGRERSVEIGQVHFINTSSCHCFPRGPPWRSSRSLTPSMSSTSFDDSLGVLLLAGLIGMAFVFFFFASYYGNDSLGHVIDCGVQCAPKHMPISCIPSRIHGI